MIQTEIPCSSCFELLIGIDFHSYYRLVCDNDKCLAFREGQGYMDKEGRQVTRESESVSKEKRSHKIYSWYKPMLEECKKRYRYACNLGFSPKVAMSLRGKSKKKIKELTIAGGVYEQNKHRVGKEP